MEFRSFIFYFSSPAATKVMFSGRKKHLNVKTRFFLKFYVSSQILAFIFFYCLQDFNPK